jgi:ankyrin repeat protein
MTPREPATDPRGAFIEAAVWHGPLDDAAAILAAHPEIASSDIHVAALLGDGAAVQRFLAADPAGATAKSPPLGWDALTHLCFSKYLRLDSARSAGFVAAARALLEAGASANTGFYESDHQPHPAWESVLYGAAGVAHHAPLTRLLIEHGADPNDDEVPYHAPETDDNAALRILVESGRLTADSLATMLLRKADWHDRDGVAYLLQHGADPNLLSHWRITALHQAVRRNNALATVELMMDHGADPTLANGLDGRSAVSMAAWRGRGDLLALFERRNVPMALDGVERLLAACARDDAAALRAIVRDDPDGVRLVVARGGQVLAEFASTANTTGIEHLLDLSVEVGARYAGDGYFGIAPDSTALHVAAWLAWPETVKVLIARGAPIDARDGRGRTALMLAVRACVDSYWTERRSPDSVAALLQAGASVDGVMFPSGYGEVDELLKSQIDGSK